MMVGAAAVAWLVRRLRHSMAKAKKTTAHAHAASLPLGGAPALSPAALRALVEEDPIDHAVIEVRRGSSQEASSSGASELKAVPVTLSDLPGVLTDPTRGRGGAPALRLRPDRLTFLVFVGESEGDMQEAARVASSLGYRGVATLKGGTAALEAAPPGPAPRLLGRDAVALLLGLGSLPPHAGAVVIDVRRPDELALYGALPGAASVPVSELLGALQCPESDWARRYRFPKPGPGQPVVFTCRTNRRAKWAAQLARDAGYRDVLVHRAGAHGWRLGLGVRAYPAFEEGEMPPTPQASPEEVLDEAAGLADLKSHGLLDE